jgi:hypothetical protein
MVSFKWGQVNTALPERKDFFITEIGKYLKDGNKSFIVKYRRALDGISEENANTLEKEFLKVYEEVLDQPLEPLLKQDGDGWTRFSMMKRGKAKVENTSNLNFIKDKKIKDILDSNVVNKLRGSGVSSFYKDGQINLPDFDFFEEFKTNELDVEESVSLVERKGETGIGRYDIRPTEGSEKHFSCDFPTRDDGKISNLKTDFLMDLLGTSPPLEINNSESKIKVEPIQYSFIVDEETFMGLSLGSKSMAYLTPVKEENNTFVDDGAQIPLDKFSQLKIMAAKDDLDNRTSQMQEEQVIILDGQMYQFRNKDTTGRKDISMGFSENGSPLSFIEENTGLFERILTPLLNDPTTVKTVKLTGMIRTKKGNEPTFSSRVISSIKSKNSKAGQDKFYMIARKKNKETGEVISIEDWTELDEEKQSNYEYIEEEMTAAEAVAISSKAYRSKEKGEDGEYSYMSEDDYNKIRSSINNFNEERFLMSEIDNAEGKEKQKLEKLRKKGIQINNDNKTLIDSYVSDIQVLSSAEEGNPKLQQSSDYGKDRYSTNEVKQENIKEKLKEAYVEVDLVITSHGEYDLNPFSNTSANRPMSKHANKIKKYVRKLKREFGE